MSQQQHTPGPWKIAADYGNRLHICSPWSDKVKPGNSETFGSCYGAHIAEVEYMLNGVPTKEQAEANARRIVACVNACAGIPTDDLEASPHQGLLYLADFANELVKQRDELAAQVADLLAQPDVSVVIRQRDELMAALGSGSRHCNDNTPHSDLCEAIIDSKEADVGQGLDPFWKWAFRRGFHEAESSYRIDIANLEKQRDELLSALALINPSLNFTGWENGDGEQIGEQINAAIASVKGGA